MRLLKHIANKDPDKQWLIHCCKVALSGTLAMVYWHFVQTPAAFWTVLAATFLVDMSAGPTLRNRQQTLLINGLILIGLIFISVCLSAYFWLNLVWLFCVVVGIFMIPYFSPQRHLAGVYLGLLTLVSINFPTGFQAAIDYSLQILPGIFIAFCTTFFLWPDKTKRPWSPGCQSKHVILRALRVASAVVIAILLAKLLGLHNYAWGAITVLIVSQASLGASIRKSLHRFAGTLVGVIFGIIAARYFLSQWPLLIYITPLLVFLAWYPSLFFYSVSAFFVTLLIIDAYYFLPMQDSIDYYILSRLTDTGLGILIALAAEFLLFRQSASPKVRESFTSFWQQLHDLLGVYFSPKEEQKNTEQIGEKKQQLADDFINMQTAFYDLAYEPYRFSRRYKYTMRLMQAQKKLYTDLQTLPLLETFTHKTLTDQQSQALGHIWESLEQGLLLFADPNRPASKRHAAAQHFHNKLQAVNQQLTEQLKQLRDTQPDNDIQDIVDLAIALQKCFFIVQYYFKP